MASTAAVVVAVAGVASLLGDDVVASLPDHGRIEAGEVEVVAAFRPQDEEQDHKLRGSAGIHSQPEGPSSSKSL